MRKTLSLFLFSSVSLFSYGIDSSVIANLDKLSYQEQQKILPQIDAIDSDLFAQLKATMSKPESKESFEAFQKYTVRGSLENYETGKKMISEGQVGCLVLAGGQGTRLGFSGPKGMYPVSAVKNKTLFQLLAEKVEAASRAYKRPLQLAIMTSPLNDAETRNYFIENEYFGLNSEQVSFFSQEMFPFLDTNGQMFLENENTIAQGPNGNGYALHVLYGSGIYDAWKKQGVKYVNVILVDNPLADPFDPELVGFQSNRNDEVTLKSVKREDPSESIGVLVLKEDKLAVVEYSEISNEERSVTLEDGSLKHPCGSISLFSFSMDFIAKVGQSKNMPLHKAFKKAQKLGEPVGKFYAWKFEAFIFDVLKYAEKTSVLIFPRASCFSPLKNAEGANSPKTVQAALLEREREILQKITGIEPPKHNFELSADFYYPTDELLRSWKGRVVPEGVQYICEE